MNKKEFLTEENYEQSKKKISKAALIVLIVGVLLGGSLIVAGIVKQIQINSKYSEESKNAKVEQLTAEKEQISDQLDFEKRNLMTAKTTLTNKIKPVEDQIKKLEREPFTGFNDAYYERKDQIDELKESIQEDKTNIGVIDDALDNSFDHCSFYEAKNNVYTSNYCSLKRQLNQKTSEIHNIDNEFSDFQKEFESHDAIPFFMFGAFIIIASGMVSFAIFMITKRREMLAFSAQQIMPVAQEGIEKMAPTIGNAMGTVMEKMAPSIGNAMGTVGKEIAKGIKEGLNEAESSEEKSQNTEK